MACPSDIITSVDDVLNTVLLPTLLGHNVSGSGSFRELLAMAVRFGGLAIPVLSSMARQEHDASIRTTAPLIRLELPGYAAPTTQVPALAGASTPDEARFVTAPSRQAGDFPCCIEFKRAAPGVVAALTAVPDSAIVPVEADPVMDAIGAVRETARQLRSVQMREHEDQSRNLHGTVSPQQQLLLETAGEKGVSSWLTTPPSLMHRVTILNKADFRDALCLRYGLSLDGLPSTCVCGAALTTDHALACPCGGIPHRSP